jgi:chorismate lyase/3-hydroxybenzoate synthase
VITLLEKTQDTILGFLSFTSSTNYEQSVKEAYLEIFDYIRDYPHLHRVWNYIPNIHHCDPIERYQSFCVGRHDAFLAQGIDITTSPAASAVGKFSEPTEITFLAGKIPGDRSVHIIIPNNMDLRVQYSQEHYKSMIPCTFLALPV